MVVVVGSHHHHPLLWSKPQLLGGSSLVTVQNARTHTRPPPSAGIAPNKAGNTCGHNTYLYGVWSIDKSFAKKPGPSARFSPNTALLSPTLATSKLRPRINTVMAVVPLMLSSKSDLHSSSSSSSGVLTFAPAPTYQHIDGCCPTHTVVKIRPVQQKAAAALLTPEAASHSPTASAPNVSTRPCMRAHTAARLKHSQCCLRSAEA